MISALCTQIDPNAYSKGAWSKPWGFKPLESRIDGILSGRCGRTTEHEISGKTFRTYLLDNVLIAQYVYHGEMEVDATKSVLMIWEWLIAIRLL